MILLKKKLQEKIRRENLMTKKGGELPLNDRSKDGKWG